MITDKQNILTKTEAYNFLKNLLGLKRRDRVNKDFFNLFFIELSNGNFFTFRIPKRKMEQIFDKYDLKFFNKLYYEQKQKKDESAPIIKVFVFNLVIEKTYKKRKSN